MVTRLLTTTLGLATVALFAGCASTFNGVAERTSLAEAGLLHQNVDGEYARYYTYFPAAQVYHSPWKDRYYWKDGHNWRATVNLPDHIELTDMDSVLVELYTPKPFDQHSEVLAMHPPTTTTGEVWASAESESSPD